ncbi:MAG: acyltransferase family protein [Ruminococcus sp.]|nr:acyltransferase family protein [Ruminococcus sp.]
MDLDALKRRNSTLDVIRIVALASVLSVHFFLHTGFYSQPYSGYSGPIESIVKAISEQNPDNLNGLWMFLTFMMRTLFGVCVPLFIMLSGYLMGKKTVSRSYYKGIRKTLIIFVLVSVVHFFFKAFREDALVKAAAASGGIDAIFKAFSESETLDFKHFIFGIFDYTHANYSWYIEMYIGLFLIIPFLNLGYNKLKTKRQKQVLVLSFVFISILPTLFNIYNFDSASWWLDPRTSDTYQKFLPAFWMGIYPIAYYYIGMYLREYGVKPKTKSLVGILCVSLLLGTLFNVYRSSGGGFITGSYNYWYGFIPCVLSVTLFALLLRIKSDNWNEKVRFGLWKISDLVVGAFLMSFVSDMLVYDVLKAKVPTFLQRIPYFFIVVPLSLILSLVFAFILDLAYRGIIKLYEIIKVFVIAQREKEHGYKWQDLLFIVLFAAVLIVMLWKVVYGFGGSDETFYLTIPHRLVMGDSLFTDEWNLSQLAGFLMMPFVWFYTTVFGGTEGIILGARILYIIVHSASAIIIYTRLRKRGYIALIGVILFYLFTPYDIMTMSYNTMCLGLTALSGVLIGTANYDKKLQIILAGLAFSGAVLCSPLLAIGYVLYALCMVVHIALRKKETKFALKSKMFAPRTFLLFTAGVSILAVIFFVFLLSRASILDVFNNLSIMMNNSSHQSIPITSRYFTCLKAVYNCSPLFKYFLYAYGATLIAMIFDKKRRLHRSIYLMISIGLTVLTQISFLPALGSKSYNAIMFPMIFITITSYILCEKKPRELFVSLFCVGVLYATCAGVVSDQYYYIISTALSVSNLAGYVFLAQLVREMREQPDNIAYALWMKRGCFVLIALTLCIQCGAQLFAKTHHVFWDSEPKALEYEIEEGPAKGLCTTRQKHDTYMQIYNDLKVYQDKKRDNILFMTMITHPYLDVEDFPYGTYSAWLAGEDEKTLERLRKYYKLNPDKIPRYIYLPKVAEFDADAVLQEARENGYVITETDVAYHMEKTP